MPSSDSNASNNGKTGGGAKDSSQMSKSDAGRIQATQARGGGDMSSGGFAARAQGAGDRNANAGGKQGGETKK